MMSELRQQGDGTVARNIWMEGLILCDGEDGGCVGGDEDNF